MTDFFADLEREIRAAHPRKPRPAIPVRPILVAAVTLAAVFAALSLLPSGEREVAQQPRFQEGWTAYAPLICAIGAEVVEGEVPSDLVDRFLLLRSGTARPEAPRTVPPTVVLLEESLRKVGWNEDHVFAVGRRLTDDCRPGDPVVCVFSPTHESCTEPEPDRPVIVHLVDEKGEVFVVAEDSIDSVDARRGDERIRIPIQAGFGTGDMSGSGEVTVAPS